jgi:hypothetical protein
MARLRRNVPQHILETAPDLQAKYEVARDYYEATQMVKRGEAIKKEKRAALIAAWGTGINTLADMQVKFSSVSKQVQDTEMLEAFLAQHGTSLQAFRKFQIQERLEVDRI